MQPNGVEEATLRRQNIHETKLLLQHKSGEQSTRDEKENLGLYSLYMDLVWFGRDFDRFVFLGGLGCEFFLWEKTCISV